MADDITKVIIIEWENAPFKRLEDLVENSLI